MLRVERLEERLVLTLTDPFSGLSQNVQPFRAPLDVAGTQFTAQARVPVTAVVATVSAAGSGDLRARIDWGDAQQTRGVLAATGADQFVVSGTHTYDRPGTFTITVGLFVDGDLRAVVVSTAEVRDGFGPEFPPAPTRPATPTAGGGHPPGGDFSGTDAPPGPTPPPGLPETPPVPPLGPTTPPGGAFPPGPVPAIETNLAFLLLQSGPASVSGQTAFVSLRDQGATRPVPVPVTLVTPAAVRPTTPPGGGTYEDETPVPLDESLRAVLGNLDLPRLDAWWDLAWQLVRTPVAKLPQKPPVPVERPAEFVDRKLTANPTLPVAAEPAQPDTDEQLLRAILTDARDYLSNTAPHEAALLPASATRKDEEDDGQPRRGLWAVVAGVPFLAALGYGAWRAWGLRRRSVTPRRQPRAPRRPEEVPDRFLPEPVNISGGP